MMDCFTLLFPRLLLCRLASLAIWAFYEPQGAIWSSMFFRLGCAVSVVHPHSSGFRILFQSPSPLRSVKAPQTLLLWGVCFSGWELDGLSSFGCLVQLRMFLGIVLGCV